MTLIDKILEKLDRYPDARVTADATNVTVEPSSAEGFRVTFSVVVDEYMVDFGGWHATTRSDSISGGNSFPPKPSRITL